MANDFASGDSFFRIDFSSFTGTGAGLRLSVDGKDSEPFDVYATNPYGRLAEESFDYFKDHRAPETVFEKFLHNWTTGRIVGPFWYDAGDKGSYPTNTAMAAWLLMNLYERWPESNATLGKTTLYEEVKVGAALMHQLILPGQKLAVAKLHTNVPAWGPVPAARDGAVRVDDRDEGHVRDGADARAARAGARSARSSRRRGEAGLRARAHRVHERADRAAALPRTSRTSAGRAGSTRTTTSARCGASPRQAPRAVPPRPRQHRGRRLRGPRRDVPGRAGARRPRCAAALAKEVAAHPRFGEISSSGGMRRPRPATSRCSRCARPASTSRPIRKNLFRYADELVAFEKVGYPGVTKDTRSTRWNTGDRDELDHNWRWGSSRMLLDDAILLAFAAEEKARDGRSRRRPRRTPAAAVRVLDWILGTNAMALSMVTGFGENAVERLHDTIVPDGEPGRMALGPNNWTNAGDPDMPAFGSLPGMKMMPVKGRGWAAREIAIDGNAPLVWVAWWAQHRAAALFYGGQVLNCALARGQIGVTRHSVPSLAGTIQDLTPSASIQKT